MLDCFVDPAEQEDCMLDYFVGPAEQEDGMLDCFVDRGFWDICHQYIFPFDHRNPYCAFYRRRDEDLCSLGRGSKQGERRGKCGNPLYCDFYKSTVRIASPCQSEDGVLPAFDQQSLFVAADQEEGRLRLQPVEFLDSKAVVVVVVVVCFAALADIVRGSSDALLSSE